jgi:hypothetical protein
MRSRFIQQLLHAAEGTFAGTADGSARVSGDVDLHGEQRGLAF